MQDSLAAVHDSGDHHCHTHTHFNPLCEECRRARAAFLPYQSAIAHPEPASRSFQRTIGPAFVVTPPLTASEAFDIGVGEAVTDRILDTLLDR